MRKLVIIILFVALSSCHVNRALLVFPARYSEDVAELDKRTRYSLSEVKILGQSMIDPGGKGHIRYDLVTKYLNILYPNKNSKGLLCINLEGALFNILALNDKDSSLFKSAESDYVALVKYIKSIIPLVDVGFYGLPFKVYYESQYFKNENNKLDNIIKEVDVLMPSLYIDYPAMQKDIQSNLDFLEKNLNIAFEYGSSFNKTVYPFFWYLVHPSNSKFGSAFIPIHEMNIYMDFIYSYRYKNKGVQGVIWWDSPTPFNNGSIKSLLLENDVNIHNVDSAFNYYLLDK